MSSLGYYNCRSSGLIIDLEDRAIDILQKVSYYRLSAFFLPFQTTSDRFNKGTKFDDIFNLYEFDRHLRGMLWDAIE
ncbi:MAG: Abi family protein, partial [Candidatus Anammoxibacter sp.]